MTPLAGSRRRDRTGGRALEQPQKAAASYREEGLMAGAARRPESPDIALTARVKAKQLRFGEVPQTSTEFTGTPGRQSSSGSDRADLPKRVEKDITYRHVRVDYWLESELFPDCSSDHGLAGAGLRLGRLTPTSAG